MTSAPTLRLLLPLPLLACALGCPPAPPTAEPIAFCDGSTRHRDQPRGSDELLMFPDDRLTVADSASPTGVRLAYEAAEQPWMTGVAPLLEEAFADFSGLSGFSSQGGLMMRFDAPIEAPPDGASESVASDALMLLDLSQEPPERIPFEAQLNDDGHDLLVWPLAPMRHGARHALVMTTDYPAADGGCVAPADTTMTLVREAFDPTIQGISEIASRTADALIRSGTEPGAVSALMHFTVHDDVAPLYAIADEIEARSPEWSTPPSCSDDAVARCEGVFSADDWSGGGRISSTVPVGVYDLPVSIWLPENRSAPAPVLLAGHGMNGDRNFGGELAREHFRSLGFAVVALDAVEHGDHPTADGRDDGLDGVRILGLELSSLTLDPGAMRGNFNQSALDKLQLLSLLRAQPDVDGDGVADLDLDRIAYYGVSMGGMMGPALLALTDQVDAAVLAVAGGRLLTFATDTALIGAFHDLLIQLFGSEEEFHRLVGVAQTLVDAGDPATHARSLYDRRDDSPGPDLLFPVSIWDETVPPVSGRALARGLGVPHVGPLFDPVQLIENQPAPAQGNHRGRTAGYFQFDRVSRDEGPVPSNHGNMPFSAEGALQAERFLASWLAGSAEIVDPYAELSTPPLDSE